MRLAVIPARSGSQRIPNKNLSKVGNRTLVELAYEAAENSGMFDRIVVSTDKEELACGRDWIRRPDELSAATSDIGEAVEHALKTCEQQDRTIYTSIATLQPAVPCRPRDLIPWMYSELEKHQARSALTCIPTEPWMWEVEGDSAKNCWYPDKYPRSQDIRYVRSQEVNSVQITDRACVLTKKRWQLPLVLCSLPKWAYHDIDVPEDLLNFQKQWSALELLLKESWQGRSFYISSINGFRE
jgi:pseudaminic acid cytidylyltransferase